MVSLEAEGDNDFTEDGEDWADVKKLVPNIAMN
jgi:hypothetical protein